MFTELLQCAKHSPKNFQYIVTSNSDNNTQEKDFYIDFERRTVSSVRPKGAIHSYCFGFDLGVFKA